MITVFVTLIHGNTFSKLRQTANKTMFPRSDRSANQFLLSAGNGCVNRIIFEGREVMLLIATHSHLAGFFGMPFVNTVFQNTEITK